MTTPKLDAFLTTLSPMAAAKARKALETQVCVNGKSFTTRAALVESAVMEGRQTIRRDNSPFPYRLQCPRTGNFWCPKSITATGMAYAEFLLAGGAP